MPDLAIILAFVLALAFEFVNGWTDAPNAIATVVATRVLRPYPAVVMATALNITGAFYGLKVAETIGKGIVKTEAITLSTIAAAMLAIVVGAWPGCGACPPARAMPWLQA
jgi:PiT family inorganic phosphate transporter